MSKVKVISSAATGLCVLGLTAVGALATGQEPDWIELTGKRYALLVNPLEAYFEQNPSRRPEPRIVSTARWRGYAAHFAIANGELVVTDVRVLTDVDGGERSAMNEAFPGATRVVTTWFTGNLLIPNSKMKRYVHMGYGSEYVRYIVIAVEAGAAAAPRQLSGRDFAAFRRSQFEAYKRTDDYRRALKETMGGREPMSGADAERFLFDFGSANYMSRLFK